MTKTANKKAIRALPALRTSLLWFKRETLRQIRRAAETASNPRIREMLGAKASKVAKTDLADLRAAYMAERIADIREAPLFALQTAIPTLFRARVYL